MQPLENARFEFGPQRASASGRSLCAAAEPQRGPRRTRPSDAVTAAATVGLILLTACQGEVAADAAGASGVEASASGRAGSPGSSQAAGAAGSGARRGDAGGAGTGADRAGASGASQAGASGSDPGAAGRAGSDSGSSSACSPPAGVYELTALDGHFTDMVPWLIVTAEEGGGARRGSPRSGTTQLLPPSMDSPTTRFAFASWELGHLAARDTTPCTGSGRGRRLTSTLLRTAALPEPVSGNTPTPGPRKTLGARARRRAPFPSARPRRRLRRPERPTRAQSQASGAAGQPTAAGRSPGAAPRAVAGA